jgi:hypothetical protein
MEKMLFESFSTSSNAVSLADSLLMSLGALKGPETIHSMVSAYSSMSYETALKSVKKILQKSNFSILG